MMILFVIFFQIVIVFGDINFDEWRGPYFPYDPPTPYPDTVKRVKYMKTTDNCDNLKNDMDWDYSPIDYVCFSNKSQYQPRLDVRPLLISYPIPKEFRALHKCTNKTIKYITKLPTFGHHRPTWARYGTYRYLPMQRWLHNLEHGAIVALYHPCANKNQIEQLKRTIRYCIYRHVITPFRFLTPEKPLAVLAWGYKFTFSVFDEDLVKQFIKRYAYHAPENLKENGEFQEEFLEDTLLNIHDDPQLCN